MVYVPQPSTIRLSCRNGTHSELHLRRGSQRVSVSSGCQGYLENHQITSDYSSILAGDIKVYEWDWEPTQLLDTYDLDRIADTLERVDKLKIYRPDFTELQFLASTQDAYVKDSNSLWLSLISAGTLVICVMICSFAILGCYRRSCCWWSPIRNEEDLGHHQAMRGRGCCFSCCRPPRPEVPDYRTGQTRDSIPPNRRFSSRRSSAREATAQELVQDIAEEMQELRGQQMSPSPPAPRVPPPRSARRPPSTANEALNRLYQLAVEDPNL